MKRWRMDRRKEVFLELFGRSQKEFENVICEMVAILCQPQYVKKW